MRIAILHYTKPPVVGGVERVIGDQARALEQLGHDVEILDRQDWVKAGAGLPFRGAGFQPVTGPRASSPLTPRFFNPRADITKSFHRLPHWQQDQVLYFLTWRLADSLPAGVLKTWQRQKADWLASHPPPWTGQVEEEYHERFSRQMDRWLDQGTGGCVLRDPRAAQVVADALRHFDGERYWLDRFVVMPNHVHVLVTLHEGVRLDEVVHSWKSFSANRINRVLARRGELWQEGYFDRIIRSEGHWRRCREYVEANPREASLREGEFVLGEGGGPGRPLAGSRAGSPRSGLRSGPRAVDAVIVHNVFTMPFDLEWTRELTALAAAHPEVAWVNWIHDVAAVNPAYAHLGWNEPPPRAAPVAVSAVRAREWAAVAGMAPEEVTVIPNGIESAAVLGLTERVAALTAERGLAEADLLLLLPARLVRRKNIELGIDLLAALREKGVKARLIVTGAPDPHQEEGRRYFEELKVRAEAKGVAEETVFAGEEGTLSDDDVRSLYRLCDALFFPSFNEGFGLPLLEAALHRLPVWCADIEAHRAVLGREARYFNPAIEPEKLAGQMAAWLAAAAFPEARRRIGREHAWTRLCKERLEPLLEKAIKGP